MGLQHHHQQRAGAPADVGDDVMSSEVVGGEDVRSIGIGHRPHGRVKQDAVVRVPASVLPHIHAERVDRRVSPPVRTL